MLIRAVGQTSCKRNCNGKAPTVQHTCAATVLTELCCICGFSLYHTVKQCIWVIKKKKTEVNPVREIISICSVIQTKHILALYRYR